MTLPRGMVEDMEGVLRGAVEALFMTMAGVEPRYVEMRTRDGFVVNADVAGVMILEGENPGLIACGTSSRLGRELIAKMTGLNEDGLGTEEMLDGLSEMVNMIAGHIKTRCPELGISLTPPLAVAGTDCALTWKTDRPVLELDFEVDGERFCVVAGL